MNRRPETQDNGRIKRQKAENMDTRDVASMEEDYGGVKIEDFGKTVEVKHKKEDLDAIKHSTLKRERDPLDDEYVSRKRQKKEKGSESIPNPYTTREYEDPAKMEELNPKANPYLAHMYQEPEEDTSYNGYSNGYGRAPNRANGVSNASTLVKLPRHESTAAMATEAEDGPKNPFSGQPLSSQYFKILKTRRNLPVHQQR